MKSRRIVKSGARGLVSLRRTLQKNTHGLRAKTPRRRDSRSQAVAGRCAQHKDASRSAAPRIISADNCFDLPLDISPAALWMSVETNKTARPALHHLQNHSAFPFSEKCSTQRELT